MRCVKCGTFTEGLTRRDTCPRCGKAQSEPWKARLALLVAVGALFIGYQVYSRNQLVDLAQKTGMQWDSEMTGGWVRTSKTGIYLYRIHIVDQHGTALGPDTRTYHPGDKLVAAFHFRTAKAGDFIPRASLGPVNGKTMVSMNVPLPDQFKGTLIPLVIPPTLAPGKYPFRLEVEDVKGTVKGFWETDVTVSP